MKTMKCFLCFLAVVTISMFRVPVQAGFTISAKSCILVEAVTGYVLYEKNADEIMPMASTTKLFTALMIRECCQPDEIVTVSHTAAATEGSSAYLKAGERLTVEQLLYALLLSSGNDAAEVLAEHAFGGDREAFIDYMNLRAAQLGLKNTHFTNPSGLPDDNHYTTARELAYIGRMANQDPVISYIASSKTVSFTTVDSITHSYSNHNSLLRMYTHATGLKTGYTKAAGRCLVSSARKDGIDLICVTLDAPDDWTDHMKLFDYGFSRMTLTMLAESSGMTVTVPIGGGVENEIVVGNASAILLPQAEEPFSYESVFVADHVLLAPIEKGQTVGKLYVLYRDTMVKEYDMVSLVDVDAVPEAEKNLWQEIKRILNFLLL